DRRIFHNRPLGIFHGQPLPVSSQAPFQHELRFAFFRGQETDDVFVQTFRYGFRLDVGDKACLVITIEEGVQMFVDGTHSVNSTLEVFALFLFFNSGPGLCVRGNSLTGTRIMSATLTSSRVRRTISLIRCQLLRIWQSDSTEQAPGVA